MFQTLRGESIVAGLGRDVGQHRPARRASTQTTNSAPEDEFDEAGLRVARVLAREFGQEKALGAIELAGRTAPP